MNDFDYALWSKREQRYVHVRPGRRLCPKAKAILITLGLTLAVEILAFLLIRRFM